MKKIFMIFIALMLMVGSVSAEGMPYFEEHGLDTYALDGVCGVRLEDGFVFFDDASIAEYPCDIGYVVTRDEVIDGKRYLNVRMDAGIYEVPYIGPNTTICVYYALYDYYTGYQFYIETEMDKTDVPMKDFTVEYGGNVWNISARALTTVEYTNSSVAFVFNYEFVLDADYNGLLLCNAPVYEYSDYDDFILKMEENGDSGLPLLEDIGEEAYDCIFIRAK